MDEEIHLELSEYGKVIKSLTEEQRIPILDRETNLLAKIVALENTRNALIFENNKLIFCKDTLTKPIIEFKDEAQAYECLEYWKRILFLDDWIIKLSLIPLSEMSVQGRIGENEYQATTKFSHIRIGALTESSKTAMCKTHQELTLVHELLHLKFTLTDYAPETLEGSFIGSYEHSLIEQMAKSLIMVKYGLDFPWFKNF